MTSCRTFDFSLPQSAALTAFPKVVKPPPSVSLSADSSPTGGAMARRSLSPSLRRGGACSSRMRPPLGEVASGASRKGGAFPLRGRWHDEVVTDEVDVFTPHQSPVGDSFSRGRSPFHEFSPSLRRGGACSSRMLPPPRRQYKHCVSERGAFFTSCVFPLSRGARPCAGFLSKIKHC